LFIKHQAVDRVIVFVGSKRTRLLNISLCVTRQYFACLSV